MRLYKHTSSCTPKALKQRTICTFVCQWLFFGVFRSNFRTSSVRCIWLRQQAVWHIEIVAICSNAQQGACVAGTFRYSNYACKYVTTHGITNQATGCPSAQPLSTMSIWLWVHGHAAGHPSRSPIDRRCRASGSQAASYRCSAWMLPPIIRARKVNTKTQGNCVIHSVRALHVECVKDALCVRVLWEASALWGSCKRRAEQTKLRRVVCSSAYKRRFSCTVHFIVVQFFWLSAPCRFYCSNFFCTIRAIGRGQQNCTDMNNNGNNTISCKYNQRNITCAVATLHVAS